MAMNSEFVGLPFADAKGKYTQKSPAVNDGGFFYLYSLRMTLL